MFFLCLFVPFITATIPLFCMDRVCKTMGATPIKAAWQTSSEIFDEYSYTISDDQIQYQELKANEIASKYSIQSRNYHLQSKNTARGTVTFSFEDIPTPISLFAQQDKGEKYITINKCQPTGKCDTVLFTDPDLLNSHTRQIQSSNFVDYKKFTPLDEAAATQVPHINRCFRDRKYNLLANSEISTDDLYITVIHNTPIQFGSKNDAGLYPFLEGVTATQYYLPVQNDIVYESSFTQNIITTGLTAAIIAAHKHNMEKTPKKRRPLIIPASSLAQFGNSSVGVFAALQSPKVQQCVHNGQDLHIIFKTEEGINRDILTIAQNVLNVPDKRIGEKSLFDTLNKNAKSLDNERLLYYDIERVLNNSQKEVFIPHIATFLMQRAWMDKLEKTNSKIKTTLQHKIDSLHTALDNHCQITSAKKAIYFLHFFTSLFKWTFAAIRFQDCTQIKKTTQDSFRILYQKWLNSRGKYDPETLYFNDTLWLNL